MQYALVNHKVAPARVGSALRRSRPAALGIKSGVTRRQAVRCSATLPSQDSQKTLYEQLGGEGKAEDVVKAVVARFYEHLLVKPRMAQFFEGIDMKKQAHHQTAFVTMAFGGPSAHYHGRAMDISHARVRSMGLTDADFDTVVGTLADTLREFKMTEEQVAQAAAVAESTREAVMGRAHHH